LAWFAPWTGTVIAQSGPGDASARRRRKPSRLQARNQAQLPASAGTLEADKQEFSFGDIPMYGGKFQRLYSPTPEPGRFCLRALPHPACTQATIDGKTFGMHINSAADITLQPKESKTMTVTFDPLAHEIPERSHYPHHLDPD
jgi:hypothetical protein